MTAKEKLAARQAARAGAAPPRPAASGPDEASEQPRLKRPAAPKTAAKAKAPAAPKAKAKAAKAPARRPVAVGASSRETADLVPTNFCWSSVAETVGEMVNADAMTSDKAELALLGVRLPSLAAMILFGVTALPLSRFYRLVGSYGTNKSLFLDELARWVLLQGGFAAKIETENKDTAPFRNSLLQDPALISRYAVSPALTLQEWQRQLQTWIRVSEHELLRAQNANRKQARKQVSWTCPFLFGIDSLTAAASEKSFEKIRKEGAATQDFPRETQLISRYLMILPKLISRKPFLVVATNHAKPGQDEFGFPTMNVNGGKAPGFMESVEVCFEKKGKPKHLDPRYGGVRLKVSLLKSSIEDAARSIMLEAVWVKEILDRSTGKLRQRTWFDWHKATAECLTAQKKKDPAKWKEINDIVDLHPSEDGKTIWSKALGMKGKDAVSYSRFGCMLEERRDLIAQLQCVFGIAPIGAFRPGVDYQKQIDDERLRLPFEERLFKIVDLSEYSHIQDAFVECDGDDGDESDESEDAA